MGPLFQIYPLIRTPPRSVKRQLVGLRRPNLGSRMGRGARALRRHHLRIRHHHYRRLCQTDRRHRGGTSSNDSGHPASKATGMFMVPSKFRLFQCFSSVALMLTGLDPSFARQSLPFFGFRGRSSPAGRYARWWVWFPAAYICWECRRRSVSGYRSLISADAKPTIGSGRRGSCCVCPHHAGRRWC
jgi:hypothetical protein